MPKLARALGPRALAPGDPDVRPIEQGRHRREPSSRARWPRPCAGCCSTIPSSGWMPATKGCTRPASPPAGCAATCARSGRCSTSRTNPGPGSAARGAAVAGRAARCRTGRRRARTAPERGGRATWTRSGRGGGAGPARPSGGRAGAACSTSCTRRSTATATCGSCRRWSSWRSILRCSIDADEPARTTMPELAAAAVGPPGAPGRPAWTRQPTDEELHRVRILAKRARYAAEAGVRRHPGGRTPRVRRSRSCRACWATTRTPSWPRPGCVGPSPRARAAPRPSPPGCW